VFDLGGIDGLLHITDISWGRINHPSERLTIGEKVTVKVIDFDVEKVRVSLGMKQLQPEPWVDIESKYPVDSIVEGKIVNMMNYGAFIELEEGVEGLIHISEMSWIRHIKHPSDMFKVGDKVEAKILNIDSEEKKISLGIKQLQDNPWDTIETKFAVGSDHEGIVRNLTQFGAFIELEEGIDGLVHISDMSWTKLVRHPKEVVQKGDKIKVRILEVSAEDRRTFILSPFCTTSFG
jgi:small subunit ribosomal protein S1